MHLVCLSGTMAVLVLMCATGASVLHTSAYAKLPRYSAPDHAKDSEVGLVKRKCLHAGYIEGASVGTACS